MANYITSPLTLFHHDTHVDTELNLSSVNRSLGERYYITCVLCRCNSIASVDTETRPATNSFRYTTNSIRTDPNPFHWLYWPNRYRSIVRLRYNLNELAAAAPQRRRWAVLVFIALQHTDARYWYSKSVCMSVCLSVTFRYQMKTT